MVLICSYRELTPFSNPARSDGLMLRHWRKRESSTATVPATPAESNADEMEQDEKAVKAEPYHYARFNVSADRPKYTEEQYELHLKSDEWDKPETEYLINLVFEYDLRWVLIADRYEYEPPENPPADEDSMSVVVRPKNRTMEDMKARYYDVAAKTMALHHPLSGMSSTEFDLHEKMTKFDPTIESTRKRLAEVLLIRSKDEVKEEEILLGELKRIVTNEERLSHERKELYDRLEAPPSTSGTALYHSSQDLYQLMSSLLSADKNKKRRSLMEGSSAVTASSGQPLTTPVDRNQRQSTGGAPDKRASLSGPSHRQLSSREELKFGLVHHDRLPSGVQFRHEKITKLSQAKSNVQATKISAALTELKIPPRLVMPTAKVVTEYERLIQSIHNLLDIRKISEKLETEIKVLRAQKEADLAREKGGNSLPPTSTPAHDIEAANKRELEDSDIEDHPAPDDGEDEDEEEVDEEDDKDEDDRDHDAPNGIHEPDDDDDDDAADDDDDDDDDEERTVATRRPSTRASAAPSLRSVGTRKRSASIMSVVSNKSSKRQRKG